MVEQATRIVEMKFGIPVPVNLAVSVKSAKDLEHLRANMNGVATPIENGAHTLRDDEKIVELTRVRHELKVEDGRALITPVHPGAKSDTREQYGDLTTKLEKPGDVYFSHSMREGFITSLIACVIASYQP